MSKGPWKKKNVLLAAEMRDEGDPEIDVDEGDVNDTPEPTPIPAPIPAPEPLAPPQSFTMTADTLQGMIAAAVQTAQAGNRELAQAVTKGIADAREPIPENKFSPEISGLNPLGDRAHPRPDLKCDFFWGTMDANTKTVNPTYPLLKEDLSAAEIVALNTLEPMNAVVKLYDGSPIKVSIIPRLDQATDALQRLVLVVPQQVIGKGSAIKNMLPGVVDLVRQVTGVDYAALPLETLAELMAAHRAKRYIGALDLVAA